jgi:hypothetical protein
MDEIEQLRSDLENAVLERDKALAELERLRRWRTEAWSGIEEVNDRNVSLRAELAQFRAVVIVDVEPIFCDAGQGHALVLVDDEWVGLPLKVYVKDDHV